MNEVRIQGRYEKKGKDIDGRKEGRQRGKNNNDGIRVLARKKARR